MFVGGGIEHVCRVSAAGMPQPSLQGWIHGVPDNALYADALSPERVLTFASALTGFDLKPHNPRP